MFFKDKQEKQKEEDLNKWIKNCERGEVPINDMIETAKSHLFTRSHLGDALIEGLLQKVKQLEVKKKL